MSTKTEQLQIRVTPGQKAMLKRRARAAGLDVSSFVLAVALPAKDDRFAAILRALATEDDSRPSVEGAIHVAGAATGTHRFALADLNDFLSACTPARFAEATEDADLRELEPWLQNYVAAMTEQAAERKGVAPPEWTRGVEPLDEPHFATPLKSLRAHLLRASPVVFKRRNIFVDAGVGDRV